MHLHPQFFSIIPAGGRAVQLLIHRFVYPYEDLSGSYIWCLCTNTSWRYVSQHVIAAHYLTRTRGHDPVDTVVIKL